MAALEIPPKLDGRDLAALLREARELRPFYTPEWQAAAGDAGTALLEIVAGLLAGTIERLDRAPYKHFLAFLDLLGVKLSPAQPARAPLTFLLSDGATEPVVVPARSQAAAKPSDGGDPVVFETESAFVATPARLVGVLSAVPDADKVFDHRPGLEAGGTATLLTGNNLQEHALYLGHDDLFDVKGPAEITIVVEPFEPLLASESVTWEYFAETKEKTLGWTELKATPTLLDDTVTQVYKLTQKDPKNPSGAFAKLAVGGIEQRWLRCRALTPADLAGIVIESIAASVDTPTGIEPDLAFANDVELADHDFYPFGRRPRHFDTFYLASREAFSKKGATITLVFKLKAPLPVPSPDLVRSWEYWYGNGWRAIPGLKEETDELPKSSVAQIKFRCPADLEPLEVLGQENLWIRARIISGDYGKEVFKVASDGTVEADTTRILPPFVESLTIDYTSDPSPLIVLTRNNLDLQAWDGNPLRPFVPLESGPPALYLGFDRPLEKGPLSFFFALEEQEVAEDARPPVEWQYLRRRSGAASSQWARLEVLDASRGLTESGTLQLFPPPDAVAERRFGVEAWWLRAADVESRFRPRAVAEPPRSVDAESLLPNPAMVALPGGCPPEPAPCAERDPRIAALRNLKHPSLVAGDVRSVPPAPRLRGVFPNTAWVVQGETIAGEALGSGTGLPGQRFATAKAPVGAEEVWIDELGTLSDGERQDLAAKPGVQVRQRSDETGRPLTFEILWQPVEDLSLAGPGDRVYAVDRASGLFEMGDGDHGRAVPLGRDNVRASYRAGGGARGNVPAGSITALRTTLPLVDSVANREAAAGGADTEPLERAMERGPRFLRHRGRAVTRSDFEALAREASPAVARTLCLPRFDEAGNEATGWVTVVVVPESGDTRPFPNPALRQRVERFLTERAANVVAFPGRVRVIGPAYVEVRVTAELVPTDPSLAPQVEAAAFRRLAGFLHPLTGGAEGRGWDFGRLPCLSDFFALLEAVPGVDHVASLAMTLQPVGPAGEPRGAATEITLERPVEAAMPGYALVYGGDHRLQSRMS